MPDSISLTQTQIAAQLAAINAAMQASTISGTIKSDLVASATTLQQLLDKLVLGQNLTAADQQALSGSLDTSQQAILSAQAKRSQIIMLGIAGALVVGTGIFLLIRRGTKKESV